MPELDLLDPVALAFLVALLEAAAELRPYPLARALLRFLASLATSWPR